MEIQEASPSPTDLGVWHISYFGNTDLEPPSIFEASLDALADGQDGYVLSQHITDFSVNPNIPSEYRSIQYSGSFYFDGGRYAFHCKHHDGCRVFVDGYNWIDAWWEGEGQHDLARDLPTGIHTVRIEFYDKSGQGYLEVWWERTP
jgi:hypothetical protein